MASAAKLSWAYLVPRTYHVRSTSLINFITLPCITRKERISSKVCFSSHANNLQGCDRIREEEVVIVGAGIAGLATALSLHRLGVKPLVLEQADSLRTGGTSLTLSKNGWRALDVLGVAEDLRKEYKEILGLQIQTNDGAVLRSFSLQVEDNSQELRAVERKALLESLARNMPEDTIWFGSHIITIERTKNSQIKLELDDGTEILAKALIGCDGVNSVVAKWMGFSEPRYVGHCAYRGLGVYASGQPYEQKVHYIYGKGMRAGYVPISSTKVYWFIVFNSHSPGGSCGYGNLFNNGYGTQTTALSTSLYNGGYGCGQCFQIRCVQSKWCFPGSPITTVTATNLCPPNWSEDSNNGGWCNPPRQHFDMAKPAFMNIADWHGGIVPVMYRRVLCASSGGIKFQFQGNSWWLLVYVMNVGGAGDVSAVAVKDSYTRWWLSMSNNNWERLIKFLLTSIKFFPTAAYNYGSKLQSFF